MPPDGEGPRRSGSAGRCRGTYHSGVTASQVPHPAPTAIAILGRALVAAVILGPWLYLITTRQVALYDGAGGGPAGPELISTPFTIALMAAAGALRVLRPSVATHVVCLAVLIGGLALLAAHLGSPFANATADYCGDLCRSAIVGRFLAFFGWPLLCAACLAIAWRWERRRPEPEATERALWSHAWIYPTLVLGTVASIAWWRITLP